MPLRSDDGEELLTTDEAAQELGISASTVRVLMHRGRINTVHINARTVLIPRRAVEDYRARRGKPRGRTGAQPPQANELGQEGETRC